jgi:protoporphyrinogen oxidase
MVNGRVVAIAGGNEEDLQIFRSDVLLSTVPLTLLTRMMRPAAPDEVLASTAALRYRSMILIYVALSTNQFTEYDAHYFPGSDIPITRLSEPKNYGLARVPGRTVLCAELPCSTSDSYWTASDQELGALVLKALATAGLPANVQVLETRTRRLHQAYPIYDRGYREHFERLDKWLSNIDGLLTLGRQGLFAHDNTHHTLAMAYAAVDCLDEQGNIRRETWALKRRDFESHVVED